MRDQVRAYINKYQLLTTDQPIVVGVSGGADSIALLTLLVESGYCCIAAHCNFQLRGEESERDEAFVRDFTATLQVPLVQVCFDTMAYAAQHQISIEMAARELRYRWFEELRQAEGAQAIAVAHHRDDSIETLLLNLVRGTGIRGLRGIQPRNGYIVRPLLECSREEIETWLAKRQMEYVTDSTNLTDLYTRNFIRLRVLPLLEELNSSVRESLARTANHVSDASVIYEAAIKSAKEDVFTRKDELSISKLLRYPTPETLLYECLLPYGFTSVRIGDIYRSLQGESGKQFFSSDYRLLKDRDRLLLLPREKDHNETFVLDADVTTIHHPIELSLERIVLTTDFVLPKDRHIACFDLDKISFPLSLRRWQKGDKFVPFGMKGRKKVSDYFTDRKFSLSDKESAWLLCGGSDILWIVGERTDNRFRITSETKNVLLVKFFS